MTRKDIYAKISAMNLAEGIKKHFGDNYTRISNAALEDYIIKKEAYKKKAAKKSASSSTSYVQTTNAESAVVRLVSVLQAGHIINHTDAEYILSGN